LGPADHSPADWPGSAGVPKVGGSTMAEIIVDFDEAGDPEISVSGIAGGGCKDATRALEQALGAVVREELTPEFHQRSMGNQQRAGQ